MNRLTRIIALALCACLLGAFAVPAAAEENIYKVTFHVRLRTNMLFAKYGVTVYLSNVKLGHLNPGDQLTTDVYVNEALYALTFVPDNNRAEKLTWALGSLRSGCVVECDIKTHRTWIEMKNNSIHTEFGTLIEEKSNGEESLEMFGDVIEIVRNFTQIFR